LAGRRQNQGVGGRSTIELTDAPLTHGDSFYIGGAWIEPSTDRKFDVIDSASEELYFSVPEAMESDMDRAIAAAREAFDNGPWRKMSHAERADYMRALAAELRRRAGDIEQIWPRESGALHSAAEAFVERSVSAFDYYASLAESFAWEEQKEPTAGGEFRASGPRAGRRGRCHHPLERADELDREQGCAGDAGRMHDRLKSSPEAPGEDYVVAEAAEAVGLPPGVLTVFTADREVSERQGHARIGW
jgi:aldehyde dehydrogenase (NAD+)